MAAAPGRGVTASVIFLHGSGDTGQGLQAWVKSLLQKDLASPHIRVSYPTAPFQPYTANNGEKRHVWYDRYKISWDVPEHEASIDAACRSLDEVIEKVVQSGISKNRIVIGGFSMGGAMAMLLTYRFHRDVAGVFALSSFLNKGSSVYTVSKAVPMGRLFERRRASRFLSCCSATGAGMIWCRTPGARALPRSCGPWV
ncbi:lysophospholipase-like protein 1 isoform X2 [Petromyzon marinus]|uniref:lysophospholipase-like protein 1 isoform X2 n=1 Tax=Petromyzon marinus TaxID=7757 RepID=UPI003F6F2E14